MKMRNFEIIVTRELKCEISVIFSIKINNYDLLYCNLLIIIHFKFELTCMLMFYARPFRRQLCNKGKKWACDVVV